MPVLIFSRVLRLVIFDVSKGNVEGCAVPTSLARMIDIVKHEPFDEGPFTAGMNQTGASNF